ncbi:MAG: hypothetical protein JW881_21725 [Spirochaetales bacterium]|nr:hypothetical protein [Spirochaetales bacterium]
MRRKTAFFIIILCVLSQYTIWSDIDLYLEGDLQSAPWFYETQYELNGISFSTAWAGGIRFDWFSVGLDLTSEYVSFNSSRDTGQLIGAWLNTGSDIVTSFEMTSWLRLQAGAGVLWNNSSFNYDDSGWLGKSLFGIEFLLGSTFFLTGNLQLDVIERLQLFVTSSSVTENCANILGIRTTYNPGIPWLRIFAEIDALYWGYANEILPEAIQSWMVRGHIGLTINIGKQRGKTFLINNIRGDIPPVHPGTDSVEPHDDSDINDNSGNDREGNHINNPAVKKLIDASPGDTLNFYDIDFTDEKLSEQSLPLLNDIAAVLIDEPGLVVSISGYSELIMDPIRELELCKLRALAVKTYLIERGVPESQVQLNPVGNIITDDRYYIMISVITRGVPNKTGR